MSEPIVVTVGGGKGGVGKSTVVANVAAALSARGFSVGLVDADLGGANLHLCVGVKRPAKGLQHFFLGHAESLAEVTVPTDIPNTWLVSGVSDAPELANPSFGQKQRLINNVKRMQADYILVDLGAGSDSHVTDFFAAFPVNIVVCDALPGSVENAYGFLKNGITRGLMRMFPGRKDLHDYFRRFSSPLDENRLTTADEMVRTLARHFPQEARQAREWLHERKVLLVVNMARDLEDIARGKRFITVVRKYLGINIIYIGYIEHSSLVRRSLQDMKPLVLGHAGSRAAECFVSVAGNLVALTRE